MKANEYAVYLRGIHWKQFRKHILRVRGGACEECGISQVWSFMWYGKPLNVHHLNYDRLGHEREDDVRVLCRRCHEEQHKVSTLPDAGALFWKLKVMLKEAPEMFMQLSRDVEQYSVGKSRDQLMLAFQ